MSEYKRDFKGVWIPREIWLDRNLSLTEKAIIVEIDSLTVDGRPCWASNDHFAKFLDLSKSRITDIISSLVERGYLRSRIETENGVFKARFLTLTPIGKQGYPPHRDSDPPPSENGDVSNTRSNNTNSKSITPYKPPKGGRMAKAVPAVGEEKYSPEFEEFWQGWPKGKGGTKAQAYKSWLKLKLDEPDQQQARTLLAYDVSQRSEYHRQWLDGFVPHVATYLNQRQWTAPIDHSTGPRTNGRASTTYERIMAASDENRAALREDLDELRSRQFGH